MATPFSDTATDPVRFERTVIVDSAFATRTAAVLVRAAMLPVSRIVALLLVSLAVVVSAVYVSQRFLFVLTVPVIYFLYVPVAYVLTRNQIRDHLPVGAEMSIAIRENSLSITDPMVSTDVSYALYKGLESTKDTVALVPRRGPRPTYVARELFTGESLEWLETRLARPQ
jgi:hypothetical protein